VKTAIILHGRPSKKGYYDSSRKNAQSNSHWLPWLQHELVIRDVLAQTPELPKPYLPVYEDWKELFEQFIIDSETILVGHSCGAGFLVRWLSEENRKVGKVVLVAPWMNPKGFENKEKEIDENFFKFKIDPDIVSKTAGITVFYSGDDMESVQKTVEILEDNTKDIKFTEFHGYKHFTFNDMQTREFPELIEECISK